MLAATIAGFPCANKVPTFTVEGARRSAALTANLNSFVFDWSQRIRQAGTTLNWYILEEQRAIRATAGFTDQVAAASAGLGLPHERFARLWTAFKAPTPWRRLWAVTPSERQRVRVNIEAIIAHRCGITSDDFRYVVAGCDHPVAALEDKAFSRTLDPKGFWRFQKQAEPERRLATLTVVALRDLEARGLASFLAQNSGEGWMLPETLRLADYGLGHDDRATEHQPVASALGPRFHPWQLEQASEESWEECERHAEILAKLLPPPDPEKKTNPDAGDAVAVDLFGNPIDTDLFGSPVYPKPRKR